MSKHLPTLADAQRFQAAMTQAMQTRQSAFGQPSPSNLEVYAVCASTNEVMQKRAPLSRLGQHDAVLALAQNAGRGRQGRVWHAGWGESLTFSIRWGFANTLALSGLSLAVGVILAETLRDLGITGIALKWPNDVLRHQRKLAGILIEVQRTASITSAIIGIGINYRLPAALPDELRPLTASLEDAAHDMPLPELLSHLLCALHGGLANYAATGFAQFRSRWLALCAHLGMPVQLIQAGENPVQHGFCQGIDTDGALLFSSDASGQHARPVFTGDVSLRAVHREPASRAFSENRQ